MTIMFCSFVCLIREFFTAAYFDLCSAIMAIEQWGFYSLLHQLWHGASVYNGHLRGPVALAPYAERLALEMTLPVIEWLRTVAAGIRTPNLPLAGRTLSSIAPSNVNSQQILQHWRIWFFRTHLVNLLDFDFSCEPYSPFYKMRTVVILRGISGILFWSPILDNSQDSNPIQSLAYGK